MTAHRESQLEAISEKNMKYGQFMPFFDRRAKWLDRSSGERELFRDEWHG
jgi:hypothetical protein